MGKISDCGRDDFALGSESMVGLTVGQTIGVNLVLTVSLLSVFVAGNCLGKSEQSGFQVWLSEFRKEAISDGISEDTLKETLTNIEPLPEVIQLDRNQPESVWTLDQYLSHLITERRVKSGREKLAAHKALLEPISKRYQVQPPYLIALWGLETDYGRLTGGFPVIVATATLAFDGRRSLFFRNELLHALRIVNEGHIDANEMLGSWAGATGQFHFLPSSFHRFAVDYDGDGKTDIWNNLADAFASAANYLAESDWVDGATWGQEVRLPTGFDSALTGLEVLKRVGEWKELGVRNVDGANFSASEGRLASVLEPDGSGGRAFLVYENFRVILDWNRSNLFAIAVGMLADRIGKP